jgi:serine phosphatase RsbU (regulator of sigma subunit)
MEIQIAVAKINKYSSPESGDTLEVVERPTGGVSVVLSDAQTSGKEAKLISTMVVRKAISLLAEGVRDGAVARAASDYLYAEKGGTASAYLNILSADLQTGTIVISRNNPMPVFVAQRERIECLSGESTTIGDSRNIRPSISEIALEVGTTIVMYTDGLQNAGRRIGIGLDICTLIESILEDQEPSAQSISDTILAEAIRMDQGMPNDDMSVVVLRVLAKESDPIRRLTMSVPIPAEILPGA